MGKINSVWGPFEAGHFQSDLGSVLHLIQTSSDRESLEDIREGNDELIALTTDAKQVVEEITGLKMPEKREETKMTNALREMLDDHATEVKIEFIRNLLEGTDMSLEQIMSTLKLNEEEKEKYRKIFS